MDSDKNKVLVAELGGFATRALKWLQTEDGSEATRACTTYYMAYVAVARSLPRAIPVARKLAAGDPVTKWERVRLIDCVVWSTTLVAYAAGGGLRRGRKASELADRINDNTRKNHEQRDTSAGNGRARPEGGVREGL